MNTKRLSFSDELKKTQASLSMLAPHSTKGGDRRESRYGKFTTLGDPALKEWKKTEKNLGKSLLNLADVMEKYQAEIQPFSPPGFQIQESIALHRAIAHLNLTLFADLSSQLKDDTITELHDVLISKSFTELFSLYKKAIQEQAVLRQIISRFIASKTHLNEQGLTERTISQEDYSALHNNTIMPVQRPPRYPLLMRQVINQAVKTPVCITQLSHLLDGLEQVTSRINHPSSSEMSDRLFSDLTHDELNRHVRKKTDPYPELFAVRDNATFFLHHLKQLQNLGLTEEAKDVQYIAKRLTPKEGRTFMLDDLELNRFHLRLQEINKKYHEAFIAFINQELTQKEKDKKKPRQVGYQTEYDKRLEGKKLGIMQHFNYFAKRHLHLFGETLLSAWVAHYQQTFKENPLQVLKQQRRQGLIGIFNPAMPHFLELFANHYAGREWTKMMLSAGEKHRENQSRPYKQLIG